MANISILSRLVLGVQRNVDLSTNTLVVGSLSTGTNTLTDAILGRLTDLQNGTDVDATYHTHDTLYPRSTDLSKATASAGSTLIGDDNSYSNFTPTAATVKGALAGIDTALASAGAASANQTLSNLTSPTSINQDLIPSADNTRIQGTSSLVWKQIWANKVLAPSALAIDFAGQTIFNGVGATIIDAANYKLQDASSVVSVNWNSRILADSAGTAQLTWSTSGALLGGILNMGTHKITNVVDPTSAQDAATKAYVDAVAMGLSPKKAARAASTANLTLSGAQTVDGISLVAGDRILVKDQSSAADNGIYVVSSGSWARATDMDSLSPIDEINGAWVPVQLGTVNAGRVYVEYSVVTTLGTDAINFEFYNPIASLLGGDMITVSGSTISVDLATASGLESSNPGNASGQLRIKLEATNPGLKFTGSNELALKLDGAGALLTGASGTAVQVDNSTIEISANALRIKDAGVTLAKMASASVDENKIVSTTFSASGAIVGGSGTKAAVQVDGSSIEINSNALRVKTTAYDQTTIIGGSGTSASVASAPLVKRTLVAGESFAANTSFAVRWALNGETAGRVYKADKDATSANKYCAIGIALSPAGAIAGGNIDIVMLGEYTQGSSDTAFNSTDVGKELYVGTTGALILGTALAGTTGEAAFCIGVIQTTTKVWVDQKTLRGIS